MRGPFILPTRAVVVSLLALVSCTPAVRASSPAAPAPSASEVATAKSSPWLPDGVDESYTLELVRKPFPYVSVTLVAHGSSSGATRLGLDHWGGINDPQNEMHGLTVTDEQGRLLLIEADADQVKSDADTSTWTVHHEQRALLVVHYAIVPTHSDIAPTSTHQQMCGAVLMGAAVCLAGVK